MAKVRNNLGMMASHAKSCNCALRPHIKTHKIPELARLQMDYGACGITCAKVTEAEVMADGGINDIFIAYPLIGEFRIHRAINLAKRIRLILAVDSMDTAVLLSAAARAAGITLEVRLEVDTGLKRTGIPYDKAVETAKQISQLPGLNLSGIYTFRGLLYDGNPTTDNLSAGKQEGELLAALASQMRSVGINIIDVSGGSTPTGKYVSQVDGVTEIRPGTYIFQDYMQFLENACVIEDCAAFVLATVVSTPSDNYAVIDGGSKTFATDFSVNTPPFFYKGYGCVYNNEDLILSRVNEEHGIITSSLGPTGLKVGQQLQIIPTHVCSTLNLHNHIWLLDENKLRKVRVEARGMLI